MSFVVAEFSARTDFLTSTTCLLLVTGLFEVISTGLYIAYQTDCIHAIVIGQLTRVYGLVFEEFSSGSCLGHDHGALLPKVIRRYRSLRLLLLPRPVPFWLSKDFRTTWILTDLPVSHPVCIVIYQFILNRRVAILLTSVSSERPCFASSSPSESSSGCHCDTLA
jgi:hypothetical protein